MLGVGIGLGVGEFIGRRPGLAPKLDLNFASTKSLTASKGPTPSFSRASTGTYFNSSGVLTSAAINAPRFDHTYNGTSWVSRGLLVEEQRTNDLLYSRDFLNAAWLKLQASDTVTANAADGPFGALSATKFTPSTTSAFHGLSRGTIGFSGNRVVSVYAKSGGYDFLGLEIKDNFRAVISLVDGTVLSNTLASSSISTVNVGNGWWRITYFYASIVDRFVIYSLPTSTFGQFAGNGTSGIHIDQAQIETGTFSTSPIVTTSTATTRSADVCQITGSDFSGFWNGTEGTLAIEYDQSQYATGANNYAVAALSSGTALMAITSSLYGGSPNTYWQVYNGTAQAEIPFSMIQNGTAFKFAGAYKANDFAATQNGAAVGTDTSGSVPSANQMSIGYFVGYGQYINGHIARLRYFNKRLPNATLQKLST